MTVGICELFIIINQLVVTVSQFNLACCKHSKTVLQGKTTHHFTRCELPHHMRNVDFEVNASKLTPTLNYLSLSLMC